MSNSSILGGDHVATQPSGTDIDALGPSDSSDSGSDVQGDRQHAALPDEADEGALPIAHGSSSDAAGTGERGSADGASVDGADILPDRSGTVPQDALDAAISVDDPAAAAVDELAVSTDEDDEDEEPGEGESAYADDEARRTRG